jgi:multidrug efflux pump subunit AcrA (membrane-fusion protein)
MRPTLLFRSASPLALIALALFSSTATAQTAAASTESAVRVQPVEVLALPDRHVASASVLAPNDAVIASEIAATVAAVHAEAGRSVERGALLISLDERDAQLALAQANAQLQAATARLTLGPQRAERGRNLRVDKHISDDELMAL